MTNSIESPEYLIIGAGIMGLALALKLRERSSGCAITIIDKESCAAAHQSGRNSGVIHGGFYYSAESLKAKFTVAGNKALRTFCKERGLKLNECGKLVVATNEFELEQLYELERRGKANGATVEIVDKARAEQIEPNIVTYQKALYSPLTASTDPVEVCQTLVKELKASGVDFQFETKFLEGSVGQVRTDRGVFKPKVIINCAGLYADKIANQFGFGRGYTMLPFKGLYLKYEANKTDTRVCIYPVPDLRNPFLGVHLTKNYDGSIKIGPTATPSFWRENYSGLSGFNPAELCTILGHEAKLFLSNSFGFRDLAFEEIKKYNKSYMIAGAAKLVKKIDLEGFGEYTRPGIRAQLLDIKAGKLVQDFIVQADANSVHILNAVSPGYTCSFPFAEYIIDKFVK